MGDGDQGGQGAWPSPRRTGRPERERALRMTRRGPHEGSVHQRRDGRWVGSVHVGWLDGKRVRKHVFGRTRAEAADKLDALLRATKEQRPIPDQRAKVGPFLRTWLEEVAKPTIRASTFKSYRDIVELHLVPGLGRIPLA